MQLQTAKSVSFRNRNAKEVWLNGSNLWTNLVVNGDFSNVSGMTSNVTNWWGSAIPFGWNTTADVSTRDFLVRLQDGAHYANLGQLSRSSDQVGGNAPFFQDIIMPVTSNITLTFFVSNPFNENTWGMFCNIRNQTTATSLDNINIVNGAPQTVTLSASNVSAGHVIRINFRKNAAAQTPAITNVFVTLN